MNSPESSEESLFFAASRLTDPAQRAAFLDAACKDDAEMHRRLDALLAERAEADAFFDNPPSGVPAAPPPLATRRFGDYELLEEIARGGMGIVYKALQLSLGRLVAVKMLLFGTRASAEFIKRFRIEASSAAALQHPNIVSIHEVGVHEGEHFLVMDYVDGPNLSEFIKNQPLAPKRAAQYVKTIAEAIHFAHEKGILHRDLKPSNVLIDSNDQPRVTDFGLAKRFSDSQLAAQDASQLTLSGQVMGSPAYMPPEQASGARGKVSRRSDVYSLGAMLYHLLTGQAPFGRGSPSETLEEVKHRDPVAPRLINPGVPVDLETICLKCLEKEPARRYNNAQEFAEDLGRFLQHQPIQARPASLPYRAQRWMHRNRGVVTAAAVVMLALVIGLVSTSYALLREKKAREESERARLEQAQQRAVAERSADLARRHAYAADMNLAQQAVEGHNIGRTLELLNSHRPRSGEVDVRGFEWRYLWGQCQDRSTATLSGHAKTVTCVVFSPDGRLLASASEDKTVRIWDLAERKTLRVFQEQGQVFSVIFSSDGQKLYTAGEAGASVWDMSNGTREKTYPGEFHSLAVTRDGRTLVAAQKLRGATVLEAPGQTTPYLLTSSGGPTFFSSDEQWMGSLRSGVQLFRVDLLTKDLSPTVVAPLEGFYNSGEHELAFSPDGAILGAGSSDGRIAIFAAKSGNLLTQFKGHDGDIPTLVFSPDGKTLATAAADQTVKLWSTVNWTNFATLVGHVHGVWTVAFSPDGQTLATGGDDHSIKLWAMPSRDLADSDEIAGQQHWISSDGSILATWTPHEIGKPRLPVQFYDLRSRRKIDSFTLPKGAWLWNISRDGSTMTLVTVEPRVFVWNLATKMQTGSFRMPPFAEPWRGYAQLAADGSKLAVLDFNGSLTVYALPDGKALIHSDSLGSPVDWRWRENPLVSDGHSFSASSTNGVTIIWSFLDGHEWRYDKNQEIVLHLFGTSVAIAAPDTGITLWDFKSGRTISTFKGHTSRVVCGSHSRDGSLMATGDTAGIARVWETVGGRELALLRGHREGLLAVEFSPDGRELATGSSDDTIKVWDLATKREVLTLQPHHGDIMQLRFARDGGSLVAITRDGVVTVYSAPMLQEIGQSPAP